MQKRGQAATEFLTTYGWAIIILIIVIGLIISLNIFNPKISNSCLASDPISCEDVKLSVANGLSLVLTASGVSKTAADTRVTAVNLNIPSTACSSINQNLPDTQQTTATCNSWSPSVTLKEGVKFSGTATISYKLPGSANPYTSKVIFSGTVET